MVYISAYDKYYGSYFTDEPRGIKNVKEDAAQEGANQVNEQYPYAVFRESQAIIQRAEQTYQQWLRELYTPQLRNDSNSSARASFERWNRQLSEQKRLYTAVFIGAYQEALAKKDEAARPKVQTQQQPAATLSNAATLQGATITLKRVERTADECVYLLEVSDPNYIDGVFEQEWVIRLGDTIAQDTTSASSAAYGIAMGEPSIPSSTYQSTNKIPQKPRRPTGSYFRKPQ